MRIVWWRGRSKGEPHKKGEFRVDNPTRFLECICYSRLIVWTQHRVLDDTLWSTGTYPSLALATVHVSRSAMFFQTHVSHPNHTCHLLIYHSKCHSKTALLNPTSSYVCRSRFFVDRFRRFTVHHSMYDLCMIQKHVWRNVLMSEVAMRVWSLNTCIITIMRC